MIADEPIVTEGPDYPEDEAVAIKDLPYAMKLYRWLNEHGARVSYRAIEGGVTDWCRGNYATRNAQGIARRDG